MNRYFLFLLSIFLLLFTRAQQDNKVAGTQALHQQLATANQLFDEAAKAGDAIPYSEEKEDELNRQALESYRLLGKLLEIPDPAFDSIRFVYQTRSGILEHYFGRLAAARQFYKKGIETGNRIRGFNDSLLFEPYVYAGGTCYSQGIIDSALYFYKKADSITQLYRKPLNQAERLYNSLGGLYFETGNFRQAKNYFSKAVDAVPAGHPSFTELRDNYRLNLASSLNKLEEYDEAYRIYQELIHSPLYRNDALHNIGSIHLNLGAPEKALEFLLQVKYNNNRNVRLLNDIGAIMLALNKPDSARSYFAKATAENRHYNREIKNLQAGNTFRFKGDLQLQTGNPDSALYFYQQAMMHFYPGYEKTDIYSNPEEFKGLFYYISLFQTLIAKAGAFEKKAETAQPRQFLDGALSAYQSAFRLAAYVEKTYDSDEARLFLNKIKYNVHDKPIQVALQLYELSKNKQYLEHAYMFDQQNKASILALNVKDNMISLPPGKWRDLQEKAASLKADLSRLTLKAAAITDSAGLRITEDRIRDDEMALGKVQEELNKLPEYRDQRFSELIPAVKEIHRLLDNKTALVSYHLSETKCIALVVTDTKLDYCSIPVNDTLLQALDSFKSALHAVNDINKFQAADAGKQLYRELVAPVEKITGSVNRLILIPDDELHYLPFEALEDETGRYLLEKYAVQYQYSTALLKKNDAQRVVNHQSLAFAPFARQGLSDGENKYSLLAESASEVKNLEGKVFLNELAVRSSFMSQINKFGILHLATHAQVDETNPGHSLIVFYPDTTSGAEYRLFAQEVYNLRLDSTDLVILSACETGMGKLVKGEGLMSLSRAFAYSGCPNIVTSLWKANDKTTAFITSRLHYYLDKGFAKDKALQQAKIDLLQSAHISPRLKSPDYWAHLVFIGNYTPVKSSKGVAWFVAAGILLLSAFVFFLYKKRKPG